MIKGVIFDLDGTTVSTLEDIQDSLNYVLTKYNYPLRNYDEVRLGVGNGSRNLIRSSLPENSEEKIIETILKEYIERYSNNYLIKSKAYQGINEVLQKLNSLDCLVAINSNKPDKITKAMIQKVFPDVDFIEIIGQIDGQPRKPDPFATNKIIEKMKLRKEEVIYVGDSETDIQTAKNADLKSIGCLWGFRDYETLTKAQADYIISKPEEILQIIGEIK